MGFIKSFNSDLTLEVMFLSQPSGIGSILFPLSVQLPTAFKTEHLKTTARPLAPKCGVNKKKHSRAYSLHLFVNTKLQSSFNSKVHLSLPGFGVVLLLGTKQAEVSHCV